MSHIYGCVKLTLTGSEEAMQRGLEVLKTVYIDDSCVSYIEGLVKDYERALTRLTPKKRSPFKGMPQAAVTDDFWDFASIPYTAMKQVKEKVPELGMRFSFRVANSITDYYVRYSCETDPGETGWLSTTFSWPMDRIDMNTSL